MITLGTYIKVLDLIGTVEVLQDMTATDFYLANPDAVHSVLMLLSGKDTSKQDATTTIGQFAIAITQLQDIPTYEVPFLEVGDKRFTAIEPLYRQMIDEPIQYGSMTFGDCLEGFSLLDNAKYKHKAIPYVLALLYSDGKTPTHEKAKLFLDVDFRDANSAFFFFAILGTGYIKHISSQLKEITEVKSIRKQEKMQGKKRCRALGGIRLFVKRAKKRLRMGLLKQ
jgi:hypothetical protein